MISLPRNVLTLAAILGAVGGTVQAQIDPQASSPPPKSADLAALLASLPQWSMSASLRTGYGYKDNLLLSYADEERSAFVRSGVELLILRVPRGKFEFSGFAEAEGTHYFSARTSDQESKVWLQVEPGYRIHDAVKVALPVTGFYYDQVFDVSDTDVERRVAELKVKGLMAGPTVRWDLHRAWWVEAQGSGQRKRFDDGANDGRLGEGALRVGWQPGRRFEARVTGAQRWRTFDSRAQYSASGRELPDTTLKIAESEWEARAGVTWDEAGHWQTSTRFSVLHYRDNGSGYFNYREQKVGQEVEWRTEEWLVRLGGSASRLDFDVQKAGIGIDPPSRLKDEFIVDVHLERRLSVRWTLYGSYFWERSRSNDAYASYRVNEGLLGLRWSWER